MNTILMSERQTVREIKRRIRLLPLRYRRGEMAGELASKAWAILLENRLFYTGEPLYRSDEIRSACNAVSHRRRDHDGTRRETIEFHALEGCNPSSGTLDPSRVASAIEEASLGRLRYVSREMNGMRIGTGRLPPCSPSDAREALHGD